MSYIILNGVKSTLIQGLLISSLPPITKPPIRTQVETVDGRDGDIVTKLGYQAYDKKLSIGLFGDFDIDAVISYFNSEGTVIFSNEPDKFYQYKVLQQIDFEKLIRFKTATVTFHVQPFKFSAVDDAFTVTKNRLSLKIYSSLNNGVEVKSENGVVSVKGTATIDSMFYVPIKPMLLGVGSYTFTVKGSGTGISASQVRLIESQGTDKDSFGHTYVPPESGTVALTASISTPKTFKYIYIFVAKNTAMNFTLEFTMMDNSFNSFKTMNRGNTFSRPTFTLWGSGTVVLSVNGVERLTINLADMGYITIDTLNMNAYKDGVLKNRSISGDLSKIIFEVGMNEVSWTGNVSQVKVENESRWI